MKSLQLFICLIVTNICIAQGSIGGYSFVEVSDRFEFVSGDNPYQLSDMMVFYLEKKGIKAYRKGKSPNVQKCDILFADIEKIKSLFSTKLVVVIRNCNDTVLFTSKEGTSKSKSHEKMYPEALRNTFNNFALKDVQISEANVMKPMSNSVEDASIIEEVEKKKDEVKVTKVALDTKEEVIVNAKTNSKVFAPLTSFSNYVLNGKSYLLKKVKDGFTLLATQEGNDNFIKVGDLSVKDDASFSMIDIYGATKTGWFNANQDLVLVLADGEEVIYTKEL